MDTISNNISFLDALVCLRTMVGKTVAVEFNDHPNFFGGGFEGELRHVELMPPDSNAIRAVVGEDAGFFVDPKVVNCLFVADPEDGRNWLEFERRHGYSLVVKEAESQPVD